MAEPPRPLLVALGDSITAGVGGKWNRGYPNYLADLLKEQHEDLKLINWGIPGLTAVRLVKALRKGEHLYDNLAIAKWIVMTIGGNDIINALPKDLSESSPAVSEPHGRALARQLDVLVMTLLSLTAAPIYLGDLYNPFPHSPVADRIIDGINKTMLHPLGKRYRNLHVVRLSDAVRGDEAALIQYYRSGTVRDMKKFFRRPIHPNDEGHERIARVFYEAMSGPSP